jgi:hypothetical protein
LTDVDHRADVVFALGALVQSIKVTNSDLALTSLLTEIPEWIQQESGLDLKGQVPMDVLRDMLAADKELVFAGSDAVASRFTRRSLQLYHDVSEWSWKQKQFPLRNLDQWCLLLQDLSGSANEDIKNAAQSEHCPKVKN